MDASLILLQELMCWELEDMTYLSQNLRKPDEKNIMTSETRYVIERVWYITLTFSWSNTFLSSTFLWYRFKKNSSWYKFPMHCRLSLKEWLWADYMLYEHFKKVFYQRVDYFGADVIEGKAQLLRVSYT